MANIVSVMTEVMHLCYVHHILPLSTSMDEIKHKQYTLSDWLNPHSLVTTLFQEYPQLKDACLEPAEELDHACGQVNKSTKAAYLKKANIRVETAICTANVIEEFQTWKQRRSKNAMFRATLN